LENLSFDYFLRLILLALSKYWKDPTNKNAVEIFYLSMKALIVEKIGVLDLSKLPSNDLIQKIESEIPIYSEIFDEVMISIDEFDRSKTISLSDFDSYLRALRDLELTDFPHEFIKDVMKTILTMEVTF
jgi:hypothetical protein